MPTWFQCCHVGVPSMRWVRRHCVLAAACVLFGIVPGTPLEAIRESLARNAENPYTLHVANPQSFDHMSCLPSALLKSGKAAADRE